MATLSTTIIEEITLHGDKTRLVTSKLISTVNNLLKRTIALPNNATTTIVAFDTAESTGDGSIDLEDTKYIRVTNLATSAVVLSLQIDNDENATADAQTSILLDAGKSFMLGTIHDGIKTADDGATATAAGSLGDLESIQIVTPNDSAVAWNLELLVAGA